MSHWIGVLDSGIGGLSVWVELRKLMPDESLLYYADTASCPYGGRGRAQIVELSRVAVGRLLSGGVKIIVVACNTMTAAAIEILRAENPDIPFVGMEPAVKPAAIHSRSGVVGILATEATLNGDLYINTRSRFAGSTKIIEVAGVGLVEMVERDLTGSLECEQLLRKYIDPMVEQEVDTLVLGCTHFPFLEPTIRRLYGESLMLENPAPAVARRVYEILKGREELAPKGHFAQYSFMTSGDDADLKHIESVAASLIV